MALKRRIVRKPPPAVELNITAFMNLMVVLVPFLLMTAVFSHITVLELNLPPPGDSQSQDPKQPPYELRVTIRSNALTVSDNRGGLIKHMPKKEAGYDYVDLRDTLKQVKARVPDLTAITILSEQATTYDDLIKVMDHSRSYPTMYQGSLVQAELFPDISIGDAAKPGEKQP